MLVQQYLHNILTCQYAVDLSWVLDFFMWTWCRTRGFGLRFAVACICCIQQMEVSGVCAYGLLQVREVHENHRRQEDIRQPVTPTDS